MKAGAYMLLLVLASCAGNGKKNAADSGEPGKMEFASYKYDVIAEVTDADSATDVEGWKYSRVYGQGVMPVSVGGKSIAELRDTLGRLAEVTFISSSECDPRLGENMKLTKLIPDSVSACGSVINQLSVVMMTPQVVVWQDYKAAYLCRAAHGAYKTSFVNYRVTDGKVLSLQDIMKVGYEPHLTEIIRKRLVENKVDLLVPVDQIQIPEQFRITSGGIRFLYGIYEIAPYSSGEIAVDFEGYELQDLLHTSTLDLIYGPAMQ